MEVEDMARSKSATTQVLTLAPAPLMGRDELNLAEFPYALTAERVPKDQKTIYFEDQHGRLTVTGSDALGLPNATDADVIVALMFLTKQKNNFRSDKVSFSRYETIALLGWPDQGLSYKRLDESLSRWHGVSLHYDGCWWNNRLKCYTDMKIHILETVELISKDALKQSRSAGQNEFPFSWFRWNKEFIESCQADNLRQLDLDTYFSLRSAIAKRLYRFLGKRFYIQGDWTFPLNEIAFNRVGLSRNYADAYKIKEKLQPALSELEAIGFLCPLSPDKRFTRIDRGQWTIRLTRQSPVLVTVPPAAEPTLEPSPLAAELIQCGVSAKAAADLAEEHPAEKIRQKIEQLKFRLTRPKPPKEPAGYLVKSIVDDYAAPKGFESQADRQLRLEKEQAATRHEAERKRLEREEKKREHRQTEQENAYWFSLTAAAQAELVARALAAASKEVRETYLSLKRNGTGDGYLSKIRRDYIRHLLDDETVVEID